MKRRAQVLALAAITLAATLALAGSAAADPTPPIRVLDSLGVAQVDLDPATANFQVLQTIEYATCLNLLQHPDAPGSRGSTLVLEAASAISVSADGLSYTFTVAPGFGFSPPSTEQVSADSFRVALERLAKLNPAIRNFFSRVVGINDFASGATSSIAGVAVSGNQLTITLSSPDPALPAKLSTTYMCAVPVATPWTAVSEPPPMAGPYYIDPASLLDGDGETSLSLLRNPNYGGTRPAELSSIDYEFGVTAATAISRVTDPSPTADLYTGVPGPNRAALQASYGQGSAADQAGHQQYFQIGTLGTRHLVMNTRAGGNLTDERVRQAISKAMDRSNLSSAFNEAPTDQYLPRDIAGFQDLNLYSFSPDVASAQTLMQAAGYGPGNHLVLTLVVSFGLSQTNFASGLQAQLDDIYIDIVISQTMSSGAFFAFIPANPTAYDLTVLGWNSDNGDPENMLAPLLEGASSPTPGATNWARFDDPAANARFAYARGLTGVARLAEYVSIDADLATNAAPLAAFGQSIRASVTSERLGCFTGQPIYGISLTRLCERVIVPPDGSYSSGAESSPTEPTASVESPTGGPVAISVGPRSFDASGYRMLGQELSIEAPAASSGDPLVITFELDAVRMAEKGVSYENVAIFRNYVLVPDCSLNDGTATPDPCLASRTLQGDGDAVFVVLTSQASIWAFGAPDSSAPAISSATLSKSTIVASETTALTVSADTDAEAAEFYVDADAGAGLNSALNGTAGSFSSPSFGALLEPGSHTIGVRVRDEAGNWSAVTLLSLTVQPLPVFSGFFGSVKSPPAENIVRAGTAINLSFSLGGDYGLEPFAAGYPQLRAYTCGSTPSGSYTSLPANALRLKYEDGRYKLTWRTPKSLTGCQELLLRFRGGGEQAVRFNFR